MHIQHVYGDKLRDVNGYDRLRKRNNFGLFAVSFFKHFQQVINCMQ